MSQVLWEELDGYVQELNRRNLILPRNRMLYVESYKLVLDVRPHRDAETLQEILLVHLFCLEGQRFLDMVEVVLIDRDDKTRHSARFSEAGVAELWYYDQSRQYRIELRGANTPKEGIRVHKLNRDLRRVHLTPDGPRYQILKFFEHDALNGIVTVSPFGTRGLWRLELHTVGIQSAAAELFDETGQNIVRDAHYMTKGRYIEFQSLPEGIYQVKVRLTKLHR